MNGKTLMEYGIAVNFFGNYRREAERLNTLTDTTYNKLFNLRNLFVGGGMLAGVYKFSSAILSTATQMEQNFASLRSTLGSATKAIQTLNWARQQGAETPFGIEEVNSAVTMMTTMGFNKNNKMRDEVFKSIGDFAGLKGAGFGDMMQRVAKASFGNWESLGDTYGIRQQTIGGMVRTQMDRTPEKFEGEQAAIEKAIQMVETGKKGTEEYKMAIVKLIGVLGRDGMANRMNTIAGAWSNVDDLVTNFMANLVGYSQVEGTFADAIKDTIKEGILDPFMEAHEFIIDGNKEITTSVDQLGRIGRGVGEMLTTLWSLVDTQVQSSSNFIVGWIDKLDIFFRNYEENVAPVILFLALVRLEVEDFITSFYDGFVSTFGWFLKAGATVWGTIAKIAEWMGILDVTGAGLGKTLGTIIGLLLGIKAFKMMTSPLMPLVQGSQVALGAMNRLYAKQVAVLTSQGITPTIGNTLRSLASPIGGVIGRLGSLVPMLGSATTASSAFNVSLLANPIGLVIAAIVALVAWIGYLIYNWDDVSASMQNVSDMALFLVSMFMPVVGIPLLLAKHWDKFKEVFSNVWRIITALFNVAVIKIKNGFETYIKQPINSIIETFTGLWAHIQENYPTIAKYLKMAFAPIQAIIDGFMWIKDKGGNFIGTIMGKIGDWTGGLADKAENYERDVVMNEGSREDKDKYWDSNYQQNEKYYAKQNSGGTDDRIAEGSRTEVNQPQINIYQKDNEDSEGLGRRVVEEMQREIAKSGT